MPTSTNIAKYPEGMLDILEAVCETEKPAVIPYPDGKTLRAERFRFYGLIRALVVNKHSLAEKAQRLVFKASGDNRKEPNILTIRFPDVTADNQFYTAMANRILGDSNGE